MLDENHQTIGCNAQEYSIFDRHEHDSLEVKQENTNHIDNNPADPAFNLLLSHQDHSRDTHCHDKRIRIGIGGWQKHWEEFMNVRHKSPQYGSTSNNTHCGNTIILGFHPTDFQLMLDIGFIALGSDPFDESNHRNNGKDELQNHVAVQLNLIKQYDKEKDVDQPNWVIGCFGSRSKDYRGETSYGAKNFQPRHGVIEKRESNIVNIEHIDESPCAGRLSHEHNFVNKIIFYHRPYFFLYSTGIGDKTGNGIHNKSSSPKNPMYPLKESVL